MFDDRKMFVVVTEHGGDPEFNMVPNGLIFGVFDNKDDANDCIKYHVDAKDMFKLEIQEFELNHYDGKMKYMIG